MCSSSRGSSSETPSETRLLPETIDPTVGYASKVDGGGENDPRSVKSITGCSPSRPPMPMAKADARLVLVVVPPGSALLSPRPGSGVAPNGSRRISGDSIVSVSSLD